MRTHATERSWSWCYIWKWENKNEQTWSVAEGWSDAAVWVAMMSLEVFGEVEVEKEIKRGIIWLATSGGKEGKPVEL